MFSKFRGESLIRLKSSRCNPKRGHHLLLEILEGRDCPANIPLLEIPGITGTLPTTFNFNNPKSPLNLLAMEEWLGTRGTQPSQLVLLPSEYNPMVQYLQANNYQSNPSLVNQVPYDWRLPLAPEDGIVDGTITNVTATEIAKTNGDVFTTCLDYLGYSLRKVAESWLATNPGQPLQEVDVVAHSMGNLLARAYVQSSAYGGTFTSTTGDVIPLPKIRNFVQMAPPNSGSSMAFPIWMGDNKIMVVSPGEGYADATSFPSSNDSRNTLLYMLKTQYDYVVAGGTIGGPVTINRDSITVNGSPSAVDFIRQYCPTIGVLVPTYDFVQNPNGTITGVQNNPAFAVPSIIYDLNKGSGPVNLPPLVQNYNLIYGTAVTTVDLAASETAPPGTWYPLDDSRFPYVGGRSLPNVPDGQTYYNMTAAPNNGDGIVPLISFTNVVSQDYVTLYPQDDPAITHFSVMTNPGLQTLVSQILANSSVPGPVTGLRSALDTVTNTIDTNLLAVHRQVGNLFQLALGRNPEPAATKSWGGALGSGQVDFAQATHQILHSSEHLNKVVSSYYQMILKRDPDPTGLKQFVGAMEAGLPENQVVATMLGSAEFNRGLSDEDFVHALYDIVLGRGADAAGISDHLKGLKLGVTRQDLANAFLESREHAEKVVDRIYETLLGRTASTSDRAGWAGYLQLPGVDESDLVAAIAGSKEGVSRSRRLSIPDASSVANDFAFPFLGAAGAESPSGDTGAVNWHNKVGVISTRDELAPTYPVGQTHLEIRNDTGSSPESNPPKTIEVYAYLDGNYASGKKVLIGTLAPGESLSETGDNLAGSFDNKFDHAWEIWVDGKPRMQMVAAHFKNQSPQVEVWTETVKEKSVKLQNGQTGYLNDLNSPNANLQATGDHLLVACKGENDTTSGNWWKPKTRNLVVSLLKIPDEELTDLNPL